MAKDDGKADESDGGNPASAPIQLDEEQPCSLIIMRHGVRLDDIEKDWRSKAKYPWDTPLVDDEAELELAADHLRGVHIDVVYCSPFLRCLQTAQRLLKLLSLDSIPVYVHKDLSEVHTERNIFHLPTLNGLQRLRLWHWRATYRFHSNQPRSAFGRKAKLLGGGEWPPLPESEYHAGMRMATVLQVIAEKHPGQRVLVVSHGKAVQVAHEVAGGKGRVTSVGYAGMVSLRVKEQRQATAQQRGEACDADSRPPRERSAKAAVRSPCVAFEEDPTVGPRKVELDLGGPPW